MWDWICVFPNTVNRENKNFCYKIAVNQRHGMIVIIFSVVSEKWRG